MQPRSSSGVIQDGVLLTVSSGAIVHISDVAWGILGKQQNDTLQVPFKEVFAESWTFLQSGGEEM